MTGQRGNICDALHVDYHCATGKERFYCTHDKKDGRVRIGKEQNELCPIGAWCPIVGDENHHHVVIRERKIVKKRR